MISFIGDLDLELPDSDRFDEDQSKSGTRQYFSGEIGATRHSTGRTPGSDASKPALISQVGADPRPISQQRPSGDGATRIDGENRHSFTVLDQSWQQFRDQCRFPHSWSTGQAEPKRTCRFG